MLAWAHGGIVRHEAPVGLAGVPVELRGVRVGRHEGREAHAVGQTAVRRKGGGCSWMAILGIREDAEMGREKESQETA